MLNDDAKKVLEALASDPKFITWTTREHIAGAILCHYTKGTEDPFEFIKKVRDTWQKHKKIKLMNGSYLTKIDTDPYDAWMKAQVEVILSDCRPNIVTMEDDINIPDYMRVEYLGWYGYGEPQEYPGKGHVLHATWAKYGMRSHIHTFDKWIER